MADQDTRDELNRLYWESSDSVADIADRLDISRRALYDGIEPLPANAPCPECGGALGFRNRTAAETREAECADCGREVKLDRAGAGAPSEPGAAATAEPEVEQELRAGPLSPARGIAASRSGPGLGAMLLAGLALGAVIAYFVRRG